MVSTTEAGGVTVTCARVAEHRIGQFTMSSGIVAEKKSVCRFSGSSGRIRRMSWMKPMSSIRSGFVEDEEADVGQRDVTLADQVEQASRRGYQQVDAALQRIDLRPAG